MRKYLAWTILPLAAACAGAAHADPFCNLNHFVDGAGSIGIDADGVGGNGEGCSMQHSTHPGSPVEEPMGGGGGVPIDYSGGTKGDGTGIVPVALPSYSEISLVDYYPKRESSPIEFDFDMTDLNLVDYGDGAQIDVLELTVQSPIVSTDGKNDTCALRISVTQNVSFAVGRSVAYTWTCSRLEASFGGGIQRVYNASTTLDRLNASSVSLFGAIQPGTNWSTLSVSTKANDANPSYSNEQVTFALPAAMQEAGAQPWTLRAGILSGAPLNLGMSTRFTFYSPGFK